MNRPRIVRLYEIGSEAGRIAIHSRGIAHAQLMSASSGPGGTWFILVAERGLPVLAGTPTAAVSGCGYRSSCLSGVDHQKASALDAHARH